MALAPVSPLAPLPLAELVAGRGLVHVEHLPVRAARYAELASPLPDRVCDALGVDGFWTHQAEAIDHLRAGRSVVVATGTASGKSLCFQAPIAEAVGHRAAARPPRCCSSPPRPSPRTSSRSMTALDVPGLVAATYDGDCSPEERTWVRANANVVLTNPEMLHVGLLPHHARWATFFLRLALRRHRRAPHPAGHLRQPRRPPAAPPAPDLRPLRLVAHLRLHLGHHRRARPPGLGAVRPPGRGGHRRRLAPRRARLRALEPRRRRRRRAAGPPRRPATPPSSSSAADHAAGTAPSPSAAAARAPSWSPPT